MNPVLEQIITTLEVTDGTVTLPLRHPSVPHLPVAIDPEEGRFLGRIIDAVKPSVSLEIGMAYPASAPSDSRNLRRRLTAGILFASVRSSTPRASQGYRQWLRPR